MRYLWSLSLAVLLAVTVGCGSGYKEREAPPDGASDPNAAMQQMQQASPSGGAAPSGGTQSAPQE